MRMSVWLWVMVGVCVVGGGMRWGGMGGTVNC